MAISPYRQKSSFMRKNLSAPGLLRIVRESFDRIKDPIASRGLNLTDCLMSGLAVFGLKYASLLRFDHDARQNELIRSNLKRLYGIERAPSDTALRERLDEVDPGTLRRAFKRVFAELQRGKGLEDFTWLDHYLLSVDGTGSRHRHRLFLVVARALPELLREAPPGRPNHLVSPVAGCGVGSSAAAGGVSPGAGADRQAGRGAQERLRAQRGQAFA